MSKTILVTGSTDGIGKATVKMLIDLGHTVLVHGRSQAKVDNIIKTLKEQNSEAKVDGFVCDLSIMANVEEFAKEVSRKYSKIDVLINNAGVFTVNENMTQDGLDVRFAVNTIAPYLLTKRLLPLMDSTGRVVNLSSAAQSSVDLKAMVKGRPMNDNAAYAQSKLAITMWSFQMARDFMEAGNGPSVIAVNPKSFLGSKMVHQAYGTQGHDIRIGADVLCRAALSDEFKDASGKYFDNDYGQFANPHPDALDEGMRIELINTIEQVLSI